MLRTFASLAIAAGTCLAAMPAQAASLDFDIVTNQFAKPAMNFDYKDGKFVWDRKAVTTGFRASGSISRDYVWAQDVALVPNGKGGKVLNGTMPTKRDWSHSDSITFPASFLSAYTGNFAGFCAKNAQPGKKVVRDLTATFTFIRYYTKKGEVLEAESSKGAKQVTRVVTMPMTVSCAAMPSRVPSEPLKVTELKLYTLPAKPMCGKPVKLIAEFHTNKPGKVNFTLRRHDGEKQNASVEVGETQGGYAKRWSKEYLYSESIERSYTVTVKGQDLPSQWVSVKVNCGAKDAQKPAGEMSN
jgi:hypothetical protein